VAVWCSSNTLVSINAVALHRWLQGPKRGTSSHATDLVCVKSSYRLTEDVLETGPWSGCVCGCAVCVLRVQMFMPSQGAGQLLWPRRLPTATRRLLTFSTGTCCLQRSTSVRHWFFMICLWVPCAGSRVVRIDTLHFLAGCRKRWLN